jgi:hypothetical protein
MYCRNCGKEMPDDGICPACGWSEKNKKFKKKKNGKMHPVLKVIIGLAVLLVIFQVVGGSSDDYLSDGAGSGEVQQTEPLEVVDHAMSTDELGLGHITGHIKNNTDDTYAYVQVEINLYDEEGTQIGSTLDNVNNLEAGATWAFDALTGEEGASSYKIADVTGW